MLVGAGKKSYGIWWNLMIFSNPGWHGFSVKPVIPCGFHLQTTRVNLNIRFSCFEHAIYSKFPYIRWKVHMKHFLWHLKHIRSDVLRYQASNTIPLIPYLLAIGKFNKAKDKYEKYYLTPTLYPAWPWAVYGGAGRSPGGADPAGHGAASCGDGLPPA